MKLLVFAVSALAVVLAQRGRNPIYFCTSDIYETEFYDFKRNDSGFHAVNWRRNVSVAISNNTGIRVIYEMDTMTGYVIYTNGTCLLVPLSPLQLPIQCLPENAVERYTTTTKIGELGSAGIRIVSYDVIIECGSRIRVYFTDTTPVFPVMRELIGGGSQFSGDVVLFLNPKPKNVPSHHLRIPLACPRPMA